MFTDFYANIIRMKLTCFEVLLTTKNMSRYYLIYNGLCIWYLFILLEHFPYSFMKWYARATYVIGYREKIRRGKSNGILAK